MLDWPTQFHKPYADISKDTTTVDPPESTFGFVQRITPCRLIILRDLLEQDSGG